MKATSKERRLQATIEGLEAQVATLKERLDEEMLRSAARRVELSAAEQSANLWRAKYEVLRNEIHNWGARAESLLYALRREVNNVSSNLGELESYAKGGQTV